MGIQWALNVFDMLPPPPRFSFVKLIEDGKREWIRSTTISTAECRMGKKENFSHNNDKKKGNFDLFSSCFFFKVSCVSVCGASVFEPSLTVASLFWWIDANQSFQCLSRLSGRQSRLRPQRNLFIFSSRLLTHWHFETRAREKGIKVDAKTRLADGFNY